MSHFAVLVITDQKPAQDLLACTMQPWHEYECTGVDDEYVVDLDVTDKITEDHKKHAEGGQGLAEFARDWGNYKERDGRFYQHTNPDKKWDWWVVGGRYKDRLMTSSGRADQAAAGDLDLSAMRSNAVHRRRLHAQECCENSGTTWEEMSVACREQVPAHEDWLKLPEPRPRGEDYTAWLTAQGGSRAILARAHRGNWNLPDTGPLTLDEWVAAAPPLTAYAVVQDGQWCERGQMGWWGISTGDKPAEEWEAEIARLLTTLRPDQWVTVVDCHI